MPRYQAQSLHWNLLLTLKTLYKGQKLSFQSIMSVIQIILDYKVARIENNYQRDKSAHTNAPPVNVLMYSPDQ